MSKFSRRSILKFFGALPVAIPLAGCSSNASSNLNSTPTPDNASGTSGTTPVKTGTTKGAYPTALELSNTKKLPSGYLSIVQGPTSDTETLINVVGARLKNYTFTVTDASGAAVTVNKYDTVTGPNFYKVDKLKISGLSLGQTYTLQVKDGSMVADERQFRTLDVKKTEPKWALISCMADDIRFNTVIDPMWQRLQDQNVDFIMTCGDAVYVDSFEFVQREKATELDIWQRYTDSLRRIPMYHWYNLVPVFACWDDHDYGTNDGNETFVSRAAADRLFKAVFLGDKVDGVWEEGPQGTSNVMTAFGQKFYMMDDRSFRKPNNTATSPHPDTPTDPYGHWGQPQHQWLMDNLSKDTTPAWIINGNQFFMGVNLTFKEGMEEDDTAEFNTFINELKKVNVPVVFGSGDVHLSEIQKVPADRIGYETYEFTSSAMHSFSGSGWDNPMRVPGAYTIEFNFLVFKSKANGNGLDINVDCIGLQDAPYFSQQFSVRK